MAFPHYLRTFISLKRFVNVMHKTFSTKFQHIERLDSPCEHYLKILRTTFGHNSFKPMQWEAIYSIIENRQDNYVCLRTGYGKSLCYQYPAVYSDGLCIVISPLISLMENQVKYLENINIPACFISHLQPNKTEIFQNLLNGHYRLLYITPESALNSKGLKLLKTLYEKVKITLIAVDEAQCILRWGKDFRPSYEKLDKIRTLMPQIPIIALSASTSFKEKEIIEQKLGLRNVNYIHEDLNRKNLYFKVKKTTNEPYGDIFDVLEYDAPKHNVLKGSVIIYCLTKMAVTKLATLLNSIGMECRAYHAGLDKSERSEVLDDFMKDKIKIIVATTAFGLGIHKSNIRCVIHYGTPLNIENYYQEVGRAGRDGERALCVLFSSPSDFSIHRYLDTVKKSKNNCPTQPVTIYPLQRKNDNTMKKYVLTSMCRREFILSYFENSFKATPNFRSDCCDICTNNSHAIEMPNFDCTKYVEIFLRTIESLRPRSYGIQSIIGFILGLNKKAFIDLSVNNKYFGIGGDKTKDWWNQLALNLEIENYIKFSYKSEGLILYSKVLIDYKGQFWLKFRSDGVSVPIIFKMPQNYD